MHTDKDLEPVFAVRDGRARFETTVKIIILNFENISQDMRVKREKLLEFIFRIKGDNQ